MKTSTNNAQESVHSVLILARDRCTGCCACYASCSFGAIKMVKDEDGFQYPQLDPEICTNCGLCAAACPAVKPIHSNLQEPECYAVWADDEIRSQSSSGGMFTLLSNYVLEHGGHVCGAAFDDQWRVHHVIIDSKDKLSSLRGSKYVQSDTRNIYQKIKILLTNEEMVLFSGCPCQVAGLQGFLGKTYNTLLTVDIFCHCVGSPDIWATYLNERYSDEKLEAVNFRDKEISGWKCTRCTITVDNEKHATDEYVRGFHRGLYARASCENCQFSHFPRQGDFTIGDWWGIDSFNPAFNDNKGTSLFLVNNRVKQDAVKVVRKKAKLFEPVPLKYIGDNGHVNGALKLPESRNHFLSMLREGVPLLKALSAILDEQYDVGIVGFWYGLNYGSVLTAYAIFRTVERLGYSAIHLNKPKEMWSNRYADKNTMAARFAYKYSNVSARESQFNKMNEHCRMFIVGSDTVWNPILVGKSQPFFFLDFAAHDKKKISYASSFGRTRFNTENRLLRQYSHYACNRLDSLSVREESGVALMKEEFGRKATRVLDPVFLMDPNEYRRIAKVGADMALDSDYIFSNILGLSETKITMFKKAVKNLGFPSMNFPNPNLTEKVRKKHPLEIVSKDSVENWLFAIDNAQLVISDSFHATCFAIILNTNFITIVDRHNLLKGRFETLLKILQLEDRMVYTDEQVDFKALTACSIDFNKVGELLLAEKNRSLAWLRNALKTPPTPVAPQNIALDNIIAHFRGEADLAKMQLKPLDELSKTNAGQQVKSAKAYLASSFILRQAFRMEYWRCRLMVKVMPASCRQEYLARIRAVKLAIDLLII